MNIVCRQNSLFPSTCSVVRWVDLETTVPKLKDMCIIDGYLGYFLLRLWAMNDKSKVVLDVLYYILCCTWSMGPLSSEDGTEYDNYTENKLSPHCLSH